MAAAVSQAMEGVASASSVAELGKRIEDSMRPAADRMETVGRLEELERLKAAEEAHPPRVRHNAQDFRTQWKEV
jgi:hypothetical protein